MFEIHRLENGWLLVDDQECATGYSLSFGAQESEDRRMFECKALQEMLYDIIEELLPHSKHETHNLVVDVKEVT